MPRYAIIAEDTYGDQWDDSYDPFAQCEVRDADSEEQALRDSDLSNPEWHYQVRAYEVALSVPLGECDELPLPLVKD